MNDLDILIPEAKTIPLLGREVEIKPLSIKATVELGRILGQLHGEISALAKENAGDNLIAKILELAATNKTKEIINILTGGALKDINNLEDKLTLLELSLLIKTISQVNDFSLISLNFTTALKAAKRK
ncbi:MAG: hypothetical protein LBM71_05670 [Elusimicrobiota bacterium]|jgi:hypothetical protein|nr:hypothetical protein [Elusimicrobiota bacterium]